MCSISVIVLSWDVAAELIRMTDNDGNQYYLENCFPANGLNAGRPPISPVFVTLGQLSRNGENLGPWVLNSDDKKVVKLNKYGLNR